MWEIKVKDFLGKREIWEQQNFQIGNDEICPQLGEIPQNIFFDHNLWRLACLKSAYIDEMQVHCLQTLESDDDIGVEELEKLIS